MTSVPKSSISPDTSYLVDGTSIDAGDVVTPINDLGQYIQDGRVAITDADTHVKNLDDAIMVSNGLGKVVNNAGDDETLTLGVDSTGAASGYVLAADGSGGINWTEAGGGKLGPPELLVIDTGEITATGLNHVVDTEGAASSDELDTINGVPEGNLLYIMAADDGRAVIVKHGTGNIRLNGGVDFALDNVEKGLLLIGAGAYVVGIGVPMQSGAGSGTVTSVGLSLPSVFSVMGSPVTTAGTLNASFAGGQTANRVLASPDGASGAVGLRALVSDDIPTLPPSKLPVLIGADGVNAGVAGIVPAPAEGDDDAFLRGDGTWAEVAQGIGVAIFSQQMASGVAGGSAAQEAWTARPLNTTVANVGNYASLVSNQITLQPGTYYITAWSVYTGSSYIQTRLYNVTGSSVDGLGTSVRSMPGANQPTYFGHLATVVTVSSATVFEYQYWLTFGRPTDGLGFASNSGSAEVYASITIMKVG